MVEVLKVSSRSNPNSVAGALAGVVRGAGSVEMQVVGAGALNQAVKALAIARSYVANTGIDLACRPTFADIFIDGEERTAIRLLVEKFGPGARDEQSSPAQTSSAQTSPAQTNAGARSSGGDGSSPAPAAAAVDTRQSPGQDGTSRPAGSPVPVVHS